MAGEKRRRRANGEGTIYQRASDGKWVGMAYVYTTTGVRKRKAVYGQSFDEVRDKLDRLRGNSANGIAVPDRATTLGEYLDHWLRQVAEVNRATTYRGYESAVRLHIKPVLGKKRLDKLTATDVRQLVAVSRHKCLCCINGYDRYRRMTRNAARPGGAAGGCHPSGRSSSSTRCCGTHWATPSGRS